MPENAIEEQLRMHSEQEPTPSCGPSKYVSLDLSSPSAAQSESKTILSLIRRCPGRGRLHLCGNALVEYENAALGLLLETSSIGKSAESQLRILGAPSNYIT